MDSGGQSNVSDKIITEKETRLLLERRVIARFPSGNATPSVRNQEYWESPVGATTITDFVDGQDCQSLFILGNGNLTVSHNANIQTNALGDKVLAANIVYTFTMFHGVWYEHE